jgi:tripartite motif-containing protein 71
VLLYAKQVAEYLLVNTIIVFKYSVQMVNSCSSMVHMDQKNGQLQYPSGLALNDCVQYLFVFYWSNTQIRLFNPMNDAFVKSYGSNGSDDRQFKYPIGICISPFGQMIVSEMGNKIVQIFE